jgi:hypothetical protein
VTIFFVCMATHMYVVFAFHDLSFHLLLLAVAADWPFFVRYPFSEN